MGGAAAGSAGGTAEQAFPDAVIGCDAASWPDEGWYFEPPPTDDSASAEQLLLSRFSAHGISGDGKLVVGVTSDPPARQIAKAWSAEGGLAGLAPVELNESTIGLESRGTQASCDGSVVLQQDSPFNEIYRTENGQAPLVLIDGPFFWNVHMDPHASVIVDGHGLYGEINGEIRAAPLRWTAATGMAYVPALSYEIIYGVSPDGTLIAGNADELFEYDVSTDTRSPIGMAAVDFLSTEPSIKVSASGEAWVQSADRNYDSFLVWRAPAEPLSVTCPAPCKVIDVSGTARVVLLDITATSGTSSWIWTRPTGFVDLTAAIERTGVDLAGRKLQGVAISDDGRVVTGRSTAARTLERFFYAVLPRSLFTP
jgi:hypothetical protein